MARISNIQRVFVTGATGFVGGNLHPALEAQGFTVIGGTRQPESAQKKHPGREYRQLDVSDEQSTRQALAGCDAAVYLVHGMAGGKGYARVEEQEAEIFARAASDAGLKRIVYLGGVQPESEPSPHLRSRRRTGELLRAGSVPTIELQASMIIGAGSDSFRIVRDLAARLPLMLLPRWLETRSEPLALADVIAAIAHALRIEQEGSAVYPVPGPEILSGREMLERTAALLGMEPRMWRVPLLTPRLSSYWIQLITRSDKHVSRELVEGLRSDLIAPNQGLWRLFPEHQRLSFDEAVGRALHDEQASLSPRARGLEYVIQRLSPGHAGAVGRNDP